MARSLSGVAPTTNCIVIPEAPPGARGSAGRPIAVSCRPRTTCRRTRASPSIAVSMLFSGAMRTRVSPQGASRFSETRLASAVSRSICAASAPGTIFTCT